MSVEMRMPGKWRGKTQTRKANGGNATRQRGVPTWGTEPPEATDAWQGKRQLEVGYAGGDGIVTGWNFFQRSVKSKSNLIQPLSA
jgi:hypothetical protein